MNTISTGSVDHLSMISESLVLEKSALNHSFLSVFYLMNIAVRIHFIEHHVFVEDRLPILGREISL